MIALLIALAAPEATPPANDFIAASSRWENCVVGHVKRWAGTGESIAVISDAALSACDREKFEMRQATIRAHAHMKPREAMANVDAWMEGSESGIRKAIARIVLDARASKAD